VEVAVRQSVVIPISDPTHAGAARREASELAWQLGFDETTSGRLAIVVTELAGNIAKHAGEGQLLLGVAERAGVESVEVLALDRGRGMPDLQRCFGDGYSTSGTPGTGLGAVARQSSYFDVLSVEGGGTAILAGVGQDPVGRAAAHATFAIGGVRVPKPGETVCGDGWAFCGRDGVGTFLVVDGLGHGQLAFEVAEIAVKTFLDGGERGPRETLMLVHDALRATRGAAAAVTRVDCHRRIVTHAGVGNIAAAIVSAIGDRQMVSHGGILGHDARRIAEFTYPWPDDGLLVLATDGLQTHWDLARYPGLVTRAPALVAGVLYRDWTRGRDDVTVVVARVARR
jgi:anti-sigma regulatory factor (Ser/Thr protein kinase)